MESLAGIFFTSFAVGLTGAVVPGPLFAVVVSGAGRHGFWAGPAAVAGHGIMELILSVALAAGAAPFAGSDAAVGSVALMGSLGLLYLGLKLVIELNEVKLGAVVDPKGNMGPVAGGIAATISNPYWILWWLTVGLELVLISSRAGRSAFALFYAGHVSSDLVWYSLVAGGIAVGRKFLKELHFRILLMLCALGMVGFSIYFGTIGLKMLFRGGSGLG